MNRAIAMVLLSCGVTLGGVVAQEPKVNPDARSCWTSRSASMATWRCSAAWRRKAPPLLKQTEDPAKIKASQDAIRCADSLVPRHHEAGERSSHLKSHSSWAPDVSGKAERGKKERRRRRNQGGCAQAASAVAEDQPRYPDQTPLPTVPPNLLQGCPSFPRSSNTRIIGRTT